MEWMKGLQKAIDYIEEHLDEEIDYTEIARQAYSSNFHFQRVFHIICGYSVGAVSYTHLDVYKRQIIDGFPEAVIMPFLSEDSADQQCHEGSHCKRVHFKCFQYDKI